MEPIDPVEPSQEIVLQGDISIDAGGERDSFYTGGSSFTQNGITERYGDFVYRIPVESGRAMEVAHWMCQRSIGPQRVSVAFM